jgi:pimeloyl-ACP methyl ester carboxylesterase
MEGLTIPVDLIWGEQDPWEPIAEARRWANTLSCIRSIEIIPNAGHCPHDEAPEPVNAAICRLIKAAALTLQEKS